MITTAAGSDFVFPPTPLPAINAPLGTVTDIALDKSGNLYVADRDNSLVLKIAPNGTLTIAAGNGFHGFSGDGGPASNAALAGPQGLAVDSLGNLYIADTGNHIVRKVTPDGIISTVAGGGPGGLQDYGAGGLATNASLLTPNGVAVDAAGNLYISDGLFQLIFKVNSNGIITTFAGDGVLNSSTSGDGGPAIQALLETPSGLAVDAAGNLYIADTGHNRIRKVTNDGIISTVAGGGLSSDLGDGAVATNANLANPQGVVVDGAGDLIIADTGNNRIRKVTPNGIIVTLAGNGTQGFGDGAVATQASLSLPSGVAVDLVGNLFIADSANYRIRKVAAAGTIGTLAGNGARAFCGDGGSAITACLNGPSSLAMDKVGNLFIADTGNNRIRKVTPDGIISTVAGNGVYGFSGDGGAATKASLKLYVRFPSFDRTRPDTSPLSPPAVGYQLLATDAAGNLFIADTGNNRIRKITPDGTISTVAGNGNFDLMGPTGDGGPATNASLVEPEAVVVDAAGNLFIADTLHNRIRKVTPDGTISTVAGNGDLGAGLAGDGGMATAASLSFPSGVAVDVVGNVFIAENNRVRRVTTDGIIHTVAGGGADFPGDGGPATNVDLYPVGVAVDRQGNLFIAEISDIRKVTADGIIHTVAGGGHAIFVGLEYDPGDGGLSTDTSLYFPGGILEDSASNLLIPEYGSNRIRVVLASFPSIVASPQALAFVGQAGGAPPASQTITVASPVPGLPFTVSVVTSERGNSWLSSDVSTGSTPRLVQITVNPFSLSQGSYSGSIRIRSSLGVPGTITIPVSFQVTPGLPASFAVDRNSISFTFPRGAMARTETVRVMNAGGGLLDFSASVITDSSGNWLSVSPQRGTATPSSALPVSVTADPAGLAVGTYTGKLILAGTSIPDAITIPVVVTVSTNPSALLLSQTGLSFTAVEQGGSVPPQNFGILNLGTGPLPAISVDTSTLASTNFLSATPSQTIRPTQTVDVSVNPAGLSAGRYYGLVSIRSAGAANSPQVLTSLLDVLPRGTDLGSVLQPNELTFNAVAGHSSPSSQNVLVYNLTSSSKTFRSSISEITDGPVGVLPRSATVTPNQAATVVVQPQTDALAPGSYHSTITLEFDDGRVRTIGVTTIVAAGASPSSAKSDPSAGGACQPTQLLPAVTSLGNDFNVPGGWPVALEVQVQDDCGTPLESGSVVAEFSTGDPPVSLISLKGGRWDGTWQNRRTQDGVTITVRASTLDRQITGIKQLSGGFGADRQPPVISDSSVTDTATGIPFRPLSPGTSVNISGSRLADQSATAAPGPLSTNLASTTVVIAGQMLPIASTDPAQIAAILPYGIEVNTRQQILVQRGNTYSQPVLVNLSPSSPAIFVQSGTQGFILNAGGNLVAPGNPAKTGDLVTIYCTGLGTLQAPVKAGDYGPPSSITANPVTVSIGGKDAPVKFSGLAPGIIGMYSVQAIVPDGIASGDQVPVSITSMTTPPAVSQTVTMAVQP